MPAEPEDKDLVLAYAQKFWDAGNSVVILMYGLAFAVYVAIYQFPQVRDWVQDYAKGLFALAILGNGLLLFVLRRLWFHEDRLLKEVTSNRNTLDSIRSAYELRVGLLLFNVALYLSVIGLVWWKHTHSPQ